MLFVLIYSIFFKNYFWHLYPVFYPHYNDYLDFLLFLKFLLSDGLQYYHFVILIGPLPQLIWLLDCGSPVALFLHFSIIESVFMLTPHRITSWFYVKSCIRIIFSQNSDCIALIFSKFITLRQ